MYKKTIAIVNPSSSNGNTGREWPEFEKIIGNSGIELDIKHTECPLHATKITREALKAGYEIIVSVGGDGTMNEVVNGFFEDGKQINEDACLAILSRGTGCDLIRTLGIEKSIDSFVKILKNPKTIVCDVGICKFIEYSGKETERYFLNISDVGIGGETTYRVNKRSKLLKGFLSFLIASVNTIILYKNKMYDINIDDKIILNEKLNSVIIANGRYFGGGMEVAPLAKMDDGLFDIIILGNLNKLELISNLPKIYKGTHLSHPKINRYLGKHIKVKSTDRALVELDGEQPGTIDAEYTIIPKGIKVLV